MLGSEYILNCTRPWTSKVDFVSNPRNIKQIRLRSFTEGRTIRMIYEKKTLSSWVSSAYYQIMYNKVVVTVTIRSDKKILWNMALQNEANYHFMWNVKNSKKMVVHSLNKFEINFMGLYQQLFQHKLTWFTYPRKLESGVYHINLCIRTT